MRMISPTLSLFLSHTLVPWWHPVGTLARRYPDGTLMIRFTLLVLWWYLDGTLPVPWLNSDGTLMAPSWHPDGTFCWYFSGTMVVPWPWWYQDGPLMAPWCFDGTHYPGLPCWYLVGTSPNTEYLMAPWWHLDGTLVVHWCNPIKPRMLEHWWDPIKPLLEPPKGLLVVPWWPYPLPCWYRDGTLVPDAPLTVPSLCTVGTLTDHDGTLMGGGRGCVFLCILVLYRVHTFVRTLTVLWCYSEALMGPRITSKIVLNVFNEICNFLREIKPFELVVNILDYNISHK